MSREIRDSIRELGIRGKLELSRQLYFHLITLRGFIKVAWFGNTISIYDIKYTLMKKGFTGTDICRMRALVGMETRLLDDSGDCLRKTSVHQ